jgi:hypothetical protein
MAIFSSSGEVATTSDRPLTGRVLSGNRPPQTEYVYVEPKGSGAAAGRSVRYTGKPDQVRVHAGIPRILGNRMIILTSWGVAMALVSYDEWTSNSILPRPQRLWYTTMLYAGLGLLSAADGLVPIANALAIGYTLVLLYQFFAKSGQFGGSAG